MNKSYDSPESWNRNAQHIANANQPREAELPDWLTCTADKFIHHYLPLFESGRMKPNENTDSEGQLSSDGEGHQATVGANVPVC